MGMYEIVLFKSTVVLGISSQLLPGSELVDDFWFVSLMNFAGTVDLQSRPSGDSLLRSNSFGTSKIRAPPQNPSTPGGEDCNQAPKTPDFELFQDWVYQVSQWVYQTSQKRLPEANGWP